jgi:hypothetical protein
LAARSVESAKILERDSGHRAPCFGTKLGQQGLHLGQGQDLLGVSRSRTLNGGLGRLNQLTEAFDDGVEPGSHRIETLTLRLFEMLEDRIVPVHGASNSRT